MYRPTDWQEARGKIIEGLSPKGAFEAGADAMLVALWKKARIFNCPLPNTLDKRLLMLSAKDAKPEPEIVNAMEGDC